MPSDLPRAAAFLLGFWLALVGVGPLAWPATSGAQPRADAALEALEAELHAAVNQERAAQQRIPLRRLPELDRVARAHAEDMAARGYLSHDTPEGANPVDRLERGGVTGFTLAAENAGSTSRSDPNREILEGWRRSPSHRENLYFPAFNHTGIGIARARDGTLVYTQLYVTFPR